MKKSLMWLGLLTILAAGPAIAQQVVKVCYQVPGSPVPYCVPVSTTNPLPVFSN